MAARAWPCELIRLTHVDQRRALLHLLRSFGCGDFGDSSLRVRRELQEAVLNVHLR